MHPSPVSSSARRLRSAGAVFAGLLVNAALAHAVDAVLHATGVYPPFGRPMADSLFVLAAAYRAVFGVLGCLVAGLLAPARPQAHAMALGALGVVLGALGAAATWNAGPEFGPRWYPLSLVALALPCAWLGGRMAERRRAQAR